MLYIVDAYSDETVVHRIDYESGKYLPQLKLYGFWNTQSIELMNRMYSDKCNKIIFNKFGFGQGLANSFDNIVKSKNYDHKKFTIVTDNSGNVIFHN